MLGLPSPVAELSHQPTWEGEEGRGGGEGREGRGGEERRGGKERGEGGRRKGRRGEGRGGEEEEKSDTHSYCHYYVLMFLISSPVLPIRGNAINVPLGEFPHQLLG